MTDDWKGWYTDPAPRTPTAGTAAASFAETLAGADSAADADRRAACAG